MNAYYIQDRLEAQSWARHYQQIAREENEPPRESWRLNFLRKR